MFQGGGTCHLSSLAILLGQSVSSQRGLKRREGGVGAWREMRMGTWLDSVEGRVDASHW